MPTLQILSGEHEGSEFSWSAEEIFVGKEDSCTIKLQDAGVSRKHARVFKKGEQWFIEDLGSSNGTWVNFKKRGSNEATEIIHRDIVFVGRTVTKLWVSSQPPKGDGSGVSASELRDLLRSVVPIHGMACPSCKTDLEADLRAKVREQEQIELIRRTRLHELDPATLERLIGQARR